MSQAVRHRQRSRLGLSAAVGGAFFVLGYLGVLWAAPLLGDRMLPWVLGRGLGLASFLALSVLVALGIWYRHESRIARSVLHPAVILRAHAALAVACAGLVAAHVAALVLDPYAKVGLIGALLPGASGYRPLGVALGTIAVYVGVIVGASAAGAGRIGGSWIGPHRLASATFVLAWAHGVLSGTDTVALRWLYGLIGLAVVVLGATRYLPRTAT